MSHDAARKSARNMAAPQKTFDIIRDTLRTSLTDGRYPSLYPACPSKFSLASKILQEFGQMIAHKDNNS